MVTAFAQTIQYHAIGADKAVQKRAHRHGFQSDLGVGNHHASLHNIALFHLCFQTMVDDFDVETGFRHLRRHHFNTRQASKKRQRSSCNLQIVHTAVTLRQESTSSRHAIAVIHRANHVIDLAVIDEGIYGTDQQFRMSLCQIIIELGGDVQCACHLMVEQRSRRKTLSTVLLMDTDAVCLITHEEALRRNNKVTLCLCFLFDLLHDLSECTTLFHNVLLPADSPLSNK